MQLINLQLNKQGNLNLSTTKKKKNRLIAEFFFSYNNEMRKTFIDFSQVPLLFS